MTIMITGAAMLNLLFIYMMIGTLVAVWRIIRSIERGEFSDGFAGAVEMAKMFGASILLHPLYVLDKVMRIHRDMVIEEYEKEHAITPIDS